MQNWNSKANGTTFEDRPNGGKMIAMDNLLVYTASEGNIENVVQAKTDDINIIANIQQDLMQMQQGEYSFDYQRQIIESLYGTRSADFRKGRNRSRSAYGEIESESSATQRQVRRETGDVVRTEVPPFRKYRAADGNIHKVNLSVKEDGSIGGYSREYVDNFVNAYVNGSMFTT